MTTRRLVSIAAFALIPFAAACETADADRPSIAESAYSPYSEREQAEALVELLAFEDPELTEGACLERVVIGDRASRAEMRDGFGSSVGDVSFEALWDAFTNWCDREGY